MRGGVHRCGISRAINTRPKAWLHLDIIYEFTLIQLSCLIAHLQVTHITDAHATDHKLSDDTRLHEAHFPAVESTAVDDV